MGNSPLAAVAEQPLVDFDPWQAFLSPYLPLLFDYQVAWITDRNRFKITNKARQIGWSFLLSLEALGEAMVYGRDQVLASLDESTAHGLIDKINDHFAIWEAAGIRRLNKPSTSKIELPKLRWKPNGDVEIVTTPDGEPVAGATIYARAASANALRSWTGSVTLDEFAHTLWAEKMYTGGAPTILRSGGGIRIASTPNGSAGMFFQIYNDPDRRYKRYSRYEVSLRQALESGLLLDDVSLEMSDEEMMEALSVDPDTFGQEYSCQFLGNDYNYLGLELIERAIFEKAEFTRLTEGHEYIGVDIGRTRDATSIVQGKRQGIAVYAYDVQVMVRKEFSEQFEAIAARMSNPLVKRLHIEQNGIGMQLAEDARKKWGKHRVGEITQTMQLKQSVVPSIRKEQGDCRLQATGELLSTQRVGVVRLLATTEKLRIFVAWKTRQRNCATGGMRGAFITCIIMWYGARSTASACW